MRRPRRNEEPGAAGDQPVTFMSAMREAIAGGTVFGTSAAAPASRAERLGLSPVAQAASTAMAMPFGFLALGDDRRAAELAGMINGLGARLRVQRRRSGRCQGRGFQRLVVLPLPHGRG